MTVLKTPDHCLAANDCGRHRVACEAFSIYVDGVSDAQWRAIERQPTPELWDKFFEPEALKSSAALLWQLAKRSRRTVLTAEQRREQWRLASRIRRAKRRKAAKG